MKLNNSLRHILFGGFAQTFRQIVLFLVKPEIRDS